MMTFYKCLYSLPPPKSLSLEHNHQAKRNLRKTKQKEKSSPGTEGGKMRKILSTFHLPTPFLKWATICLKASPGNGRKCGKLVPLPPARLLAGPTTTEWKVNYCSHHFKDNFSPIFSRFDSGGPGNGNGYDIHLGFTDGRLFPPFIGPFRSSSFFFFGFHYYWPNEGCWSTSKVFPQVFLWILQRSARNEYWLLGDNHFFVLWTIFREETFLGQKQNQIIMTMLLENFTRKTPVEWVTIIVFRKYANTSLQHFQKDRQQGGQYTIICYCKLILLFEIIVCP